MTDDTQGGVDHAVRTEREGFKALVSAKIKAVDNAAVMGRLSSDVATHTKNILSALIGDVDAELHLADEDHQEYYT